MATATQGNTQTTLKAFEDKIQAQIDGAKTKLQQFEATAKAKGSAAETATVNNLKTTKQNIDRKLQDLKTTHDTHVAHAKSDIEADVAKFKASVEELGAKFKTIKK
jgi:gas vesicle protein